MVSPLLSARPSLPLCFPLCLKAPGTASSAESGQAPPVLFQLRSTALTTSVACSSIYRLKGLQTPPPPRVPHREPA